MIIRIAPHSEGGFSYDVWAGYDEPEDVTDVDPDDGGICTSDDIDIALQAAFDVARDINNRPNP